MELERFNKIWASADYPPTPVPEDLLASVEQRLGVRFPIDYREAVLSVGLPWPTIALLDAIVERELDVHSLSELFSPQEIIEDTIAWRALGMPEQLIAFASDDLGNKFCFDANRLREGGTDGYAIWFFDHDFGSVDQIAESFDAWISAFCVIEPLHEAKDN